MELLGILITTLMLGTAASGPTGPNYACDSIIRDVFPEWFRHCTDCQYSGWTEWEQVPHSVMSVTKSSCETGRIYIEKRSQRLTRGSILDCTPSEQMRRVCYPTEDVRLATLLRLGGTLENSYEYTTSPLRTKRDGKCKDTNFCDGIPLGKRHVPSMQNPVKRSRPADNENIPVFSETETPIPFTYEEHGHRLRRETSNNKCGPGKEQYVIFVLDTSGSIGNADFIKMKTGVSILSGLFCDDVKIAVLTFSNELHLEFCFSCFNNQMGKMDRVDRALHIKDIVYRGGSTHTARATNCICNEMLKEECGITNPDDACVDVIYITDGASNDPSLEICEEIHCLHYHCLNINTYSIGIGGAVSSEAVQRELKCIHDDATDNEMSLFQFDTFDEFLETMNKLLLDQNVNRNTNQLMC